MTDPPTLEERLPALWQYRANAAPANILTGSLTNKLPEVRCDVLQLWFTGDGFVCTEGQAKSSGQFVKAPGTFRSAMSHPLSFSCHDVLLLQQQQQQQDAYPLLIEGS